MENNFQKKLEKIFKDNKKNIFININSKKYTYHDINKISDKISQILLKHKINKNNIIAISAEKKYLCFCIYFCMP